MDGPYDAPISKVGQVTIPLPIREALKIDHPDRVHFLLADFLDGAALLVPEATLQRWLSIGLQSAMDEVRGESD